MHTYDWMPAYNTGDSLIDQQHRLFLDLINRMILCQKRARPVLADLAEEVLLYAAFHFRSEENRMRASDYPRQEAHQHEHTILVEQAQGMADAFAKSEVTLEAFLLFLVKWFVTHSNDEDKVLVRHLKQVEKEPVACAAS